MSEESQQEVAYDNSEIKDIPGVGPASVEKLSAAGIHNLIDVVARSPRELAQILDDKEKANKRVALARLLPAEFNIAFEGSCGQIGRQEEARGTQSG